MLRIDDVISELVDIRDTHGNILVDVETSTECENAVAVKVTPELDEKFATIMGELA